LEESKTEGDRMEVTTFRNSNPDARRTINLNDLVRENLTRINGTLRYLDELRPDLVTQYADSLAKRLETAIDDFQVDYSEMKTKDIVSELDFLSRFIELEDLIVRFTFKQLNLPSSYRPLENEIDVLSKDWLKATNILKYERVKAILDVIPRDEGIELWKSMVFRATEAYMENNKEELHPPISEIIDGWMKAGSEEDSNFHYSVVKFDDYKVALKFDRCPVYDSVKDLDDPEVAYLSYCWTGKPEEELNDRVRRKNTPQTLHTSDYCIEFYWDNNVHPNAVPPSAEFLRTIGKD
jgi:hypothetical protein